MRGPQHGPRRHCTQPIQRPGPGSLLGELRQPGPSYSEGSKTAANVIRPTAMSATLGGQLRPWAALPECVRLNHRAIQRRRHGGRPRSFEKRLYCLACVTEFIRCLILLTLLLSDQSGSERQSLAEQKRRLLSQTRLESTEETFGGVSSESLRARLIL